MYQYKNNLFVLVISDEPRIWDLNFSSINRENPPIQQNHCNSWISNAIGMPFEINNTIQKHCSIVFFMTESTLSNYYCVVAP